MSKVIVEFDVDDDQLSQVLGIVNGVVTIPVAEAPTTGTSKKEAAAQKRRDKAAKKKADAAAVAGKAAEIMEEALDGGDPDPLGLDESVTSEVTATKEDVRAALIEFRNVRDKAGAKGNDDARKLLKSFGAETLGGLDAEKYAEVITACQK